MQKQDMRTLDEPTELQVKFIKKLNSNSSGSMNPAASASPSTETASHRGLPETLNLDSNASRGSEIRHQPSMDRPGSGCIPVKGLDR